VPRVRKTPRRAATGNPVLTHKGGFRCNMHTVLWSPVGAPAGVPGPRRNADECDAGWFAPVATRRRPIFVGLLADFATARSVFPGGYPPEPPGRPTPWAVLVGWPPGWSGRWPPAESRPGTTCPGPVSERSRPVLARPWAIPAGPEAAGIAGGGRYRRTRAAAHGGAGVAGLGAPRSRGGYTPLRCVKTEPGLRYSLWPFPDGKGGRVRPSRTGGIMRAAFTFS
jgi:hypothetical protein